MLPLSPTMLSESRPCRPCVVVAADIGPGAAEDHVAAVGALGLRGQREQVRAAADDVVTAEVAEDDIAIPRRPRCSRRRRSSPRTTGRARAGPDRRANAPKAVGVPRGGVDRAVALDRVVAELTEDRVVARAAGDVVGAEAVGGGGCVVVEERDAEVAPHGRAGGVVLPRAGHQRVAGGQQVGAVDHAADQHAEPRVGVVAERRATVEDRAVAEDEVVVGAAVDAVAHRATEEDVLAAASADGVGSADRRVDRREEVVGRTTPSVKSSTPPLPHSAKTVPAASIHCTMPRSPKMMSAPEPPFSWSSPMPPKMMSGRLEVWPLTMSLSVMPTGRIAPVRRHRELLACGASDLDDDVGGRAVLAAPGWRR